MSDTFQAGRLHLFVEEWEKLTSDPYILDIVKNCHINVNADIELYSLQSNQRLQYNFNKKQTVVIKKEIGKLIEIGLVKEVYSHQKQFLSPIFLRPKKNGEYRMVLNLKKLNEYIPYEHFKMDTFEKALTLVTKGSYLASVDLKHAYYSIKK